MTHPRVLTSTELDATMTRLRAGWTLEAVRKRLGVNAHTLRDALKARYADYDAVMCQHKQHRKGIKRAPRPAAPTPERKPRRPMVDKRAGERLEAERAAHLAQIPPHRRGRAMRDFSDEELAELTAKIRGYAATHRGLSPSTTPNGWLTYV